MVQERLRNPRAAVDKFVADTQARNGNQARAARANQDDGAMAPPGTDAPADAQAARRQAAESRVLTLVAAGELSAAATAAQRVTNPTPIVQTTQQLINDVCTKIPQSRPQHQDPPPPMPAAHPPPADAAAARITLPPLHRIFKQLKPLKAPGLTGLRLEHLIILRRPSMAGASIHTKAVLELIANGDVPDSVRPWLFGGRLCVFTKETDPGQAPPPGNIRPIVLGNLHVKAAAKGLQMITRGPINAHLRKHAQFGIGTPGGIEFVAHAVNALAAANPTHTRVLADVANFYGTISRRAIVVAIKGCTEPAALQLLPFFNCHYSMDFDSPHHPRLFLPPSTDFPRGHWITMPRGVGQGEIIGGWAACIAAAHTRQLAMSHMSVPAREQVFTPAIIDDLILVGRTDLVIEALNCFKRANKELQTDSEFNHSKFKVYPERYNENGAPIIQPQFRNAGWGIDVINEARGFKFIGTFHGNAQAKEQFVLDSADASIKGLIAFCGDLEHTQHRMLLLNKCGAHHIAHLARTIHPGNTNEGAQRHDAAVIDAALAGTGIVLQGPPTDNPIFQGPRREQEFRSQVRAQIKLPITMCGHAVGNTAARAAPAYVSAFYAAVKTAASLVDNDPAMRNVLAALEHVYKHGEGGNAKTPGQLMADMRDHITQHSHDAITLGANINDPAINALPSNDWAECVEGRFPKKMQHHICSLNDRISWALEVFCPAPAPRRAMLISMCQPGANAAIAAIPSHPALCIGNEAYNYHMRCKFGDPRLAEEQAMIAGKCCPHLHGGPDYPSNGEHGNNCPRFGAAHSKHGQVATAIVACAKEYCPGITVKYDAKIDTPDAHSGQRPDIIVHGLGLRAGALIIEVAVPNPAANSVAHHSALTALYTAKGRERDKTRKYAPLAEASNSELLIAVVEVPGALGPQLRTIIARIAHRCKLANLELPPYATWAARSYGSLISQRISAALIKGNWIAFSRLQSALSLH